MSTFISPLRLQAYYLGARIDTRELENQDVIARSPLMLRRKEGGLVVIFRFGAVVLIDMGEYEASMFIDQLRGSIINPVDAPATEGLEARLGTSDGLDVEGLLQLQDASAPRLQVVATVLAKSVVLAYYEAGISHSFDRVEKIVENLRAGGRRTNDRELLREIGEVLATEARMVGRVEIAEKPESAWDAPELDRLYEKLAVEYELRDRDLALSRKLEVVSETAHTQLELLYNRRTLRVEWYIVILIVFEIVLTLVEKLA